MQDIKPYSVLKGIYCKDLSAYQRLETRVVDIGGVPLGGKNPIRLQSMTTTDTMDVKATVDQSIRMIEAGSEYVRITAPSKNEAYQLEEIKKGIRSAGFDTPLIADIHFTPNAAEIAARIVEKVRINPGNYADKKKFQVLEYSDGDYLIELERIGQRFVPLIKICKEYGTAMRIGTNHGSLSDRIMSRYGDTPLGMTESAMEFLRICEANNYYDIILSMKASNPQVMVQAYRLLISKMQEENMHYPLHLGVTEAGDGEDGRIKSAMGIGALLEDGIGDTIRVSLTEEPEAELPVARQLVNRYFDRPGHQFITDIKNVPVDPYSYTKRPADTVLNIGSSNIPVVMVDGQDLDRSNPLELKSFGYEYDVLLDKWHITDQAADYIYLGNEDLGYEIPGTLQKVFEGQFYGENPLNGFPFFNVNQYLSSPGHGKLSFINCQLEDFDSQFLLALKTKGNTVLVLNSDNKHKMAGMRAAIFKLMENKIDCPVILSAEYPDEEMDIIRLYASTDLGTLLLDGMGDGVFIRMSNPDNAFINRLSFGILQAARVRISKTEYISCPSCGRTLFDLQDTTAMIREHTHHLKGLKIGIMGCIVNGPGEMADADYGYVGSGTGKITLYKGKEVMKRNIQSDQALTELIELIKVNGDWVEPEI